MKNILGLFCSLGKAIICKGCSKNLFHCLVHAITKDEVCIWYLLLVKQQKNSFIFFNHLLFLLIFIFKIPPFYKSGCLLLNK